LDIFTTKAQMNELCYQQIKIKGASKQPWGGNTGMGCLRYF